MPTFTYDPTTDVGKVRLLIADTDISAYDFTDDEVEVALAEQDSSIKRASALLLLALASNRARLAVSVKRGAVSEDLSKIAAELRAQAQTFLDQEEVPLEAVISPSYERFSYDRNLIRYKQRRDGRERYEDVEEAP